MGAESIPTFGSGTLGYVNFTAESSGDFLGASGFLLGQVDVAAAQPHDERRRGHRAADPQHRRTRAGSQGRDAAAPQQPRAVRRPRAPSARGQPRRNAEHPAQHRSLYPDPLQLRGTACANGIFPEYTFSSSHPDIGDFVKENLASPEPHTTPLQGPDGKPIPDEPTASEPIPKQESGLFCAYNAGTTIVTISAGGLSSSLPVTVQAGSVRQPCGTAPLKELPKVQQQAVIPPPPAARARARRARAGLHPSAGASTAPAAVIALPPAPGVTASVSAAVLPPTGAYRAGARVRAAAGPHARPPDAPDAGPRRSPRRSRSPNTKTRRRARPSPSPPRRSPTARPNTSPRLPTSSGIVLLAAFAGASIRGSSRRGRRELRVAPATLSTMRAQRRMDPRYRGRL